jgi:membrane-bound lytic murein transglycosylase D
MSRCVYFRLTSVTALLSVLFLSACSTSSKPSGSAAASEEIYEELIGDVDNAEDVIEDEKATQLEEVELVAELTGEEEDLSPQILMAMRARNHENARDDRSRIVGSANINEPLNYERKSYFLYGAEHLNLENYYFDIPVVYNAATQRWINYFLTRGRGFFERYGARAGRYAPLFGKILEEHGLPRDLIFLAMAESGFQNKARSWARAVGPWQFMPFTGRRFGLHIDWYIDERRDPIKATVAASQYLKKLYEEFGSWELAMAGYNAGEGKIGRAIRMYSTHNFWEISKGRYLKPETKNYVPKIMALAIIGKNLKSFGFEGIEFHEPLDFEEVNVLPMTDMMVLAERLGIDFADLHALNPEIQRWFTPPGIEDYTLRLPRGSARKYARLNEQDKKNLIASRFQSHTIRSERATLAEVARVNNLGNNADVLAQINGMPVGRNLRRGDTVLLPFRQGQGRRDRMYADLYEQPRRVVRERNQYRNRIEQAKRRAQPIRNPSVYYTVQRGDSLWSVSQKTGVSLDTLIVSNLGIVQNRMIREGDRLAIR